MGLFRGRGTERPITADGVALPAGAVDVRAAYPTPLTPRRRWIVGLSTLLLDPDTGSCARLHPSAFVHRRTPDEHRRDLEAHWDVTDVGSLLVSINWLLQSGQRGELARTVGHPPLAWDLARVVVLPRRAFAAGYVDESTAWELMEAAVEPAYRTYASWGAFVRDNLDGRNAWAGRRHSWMDRHAARWWSPSLYAESPWQSVPWTAARDSSPPDPRPRPRPSRPSRLVVSSPGVG